MKPIPEKEYHTFFEIGIILKAIHSVIEIILGLLLYFTSAEVINNMIFYILGDELTEQPRDTLLGFLLQGFNGLSAGSHAFWTYTLLSHGIVKLFLIVGLLKNKLWAYPAAAGVFTLFVLYQIYQMFVIPSIFLDIITVIDIAVIFLTIHEYNYQKKKRAA